ncbi:MAG TPA: transcription elongation factor GreB [Burkholderiales bacterium]
MSKAFVKESDDARDDVPEAPELRAPGGKNYITPAGFARLKAELKHLVETDRPEVVRTVSWAAKNGDRSENGDYLYGKKRLREIDRRVRFLIRRLENAEVVHSAGRETDQVFFGASVHLRAGDGTTRSVTLVGGDEVDPARGRVSWFSPIGRALLKAREGDVVTLRSPAGEDALEILEVQYLTIN